LKISLMTITQHALLYNFHTSNLIFEEIFFLKFLSMQPLAQILSCNFLACVEPDRTRYVIGDFGPPDYYRNVLFGQKLCWSIVVALRHC